MSTRSRPSASRKTKAAIALAILLGLLGGIAIYRSRLTSPAQPAEPPVADTRGTDEPRSSAPLAPSEGGTARTTVAPPAASGGEVSVIVPTRSSDRVSSRSNDPTTAVERFAPPPPRGLFRISGIPSGPLAPGLSAWLDLVLTNPNAFPITVRSLTVRLRSIRAPSADPGHSCGARDFTVAQFSGGGLSLRPASTTSLGRLGVARARWPRIGMPDRMVNQDGCKGASLRLDYRGVGR